MLGIYIRKSGDGERDETSVDKQMEFGLNLATELNLDYEIYQDLGSSGTKPLEERDRFFDLYKDINSGKLSHIYAYDQSRLERNTLVFSAFQTIVVNKNCRYFEATGEKHFTNPDVLFSSTVMSASNQFYAALVSENVKNSIRISAAKGKFRGHQAYGYRLDSEKRIEIHPEESEIIKRIFRESLSGKGPYTIANGLNGEGIPTKFNKRKGKGKSKRIDKFTKSVTEHPYDEVKWRGNVISDIIKNPIYYGKKILNNKEYDVPAIFEKEYWEKVNKNRPRNVNPPGKKQEYNYLLNDLLICKCCGKKFVGMIKKDAATYRCKGRIKGKVNDEVVCLNSHGLTIPRLDTFILKHLFLDKSLEDGLLELASRSSHFNNLKESVKKLKEDLGKAKKKRDYAYKLYREEENEGDALIKADYQDARKKYDSIKFELEKLEMELLNSKPEQVKNRTKKLLREYTVQLDFQNIKRLVHSIVEKIEIEYIKEPGKKGDFLLTIFYNGYNRINRFKTNWKMLTWSWVTIFETMGFVKIENPKTTGISEVDGYSDKLAKAIKSLHEEEEVKGKIDDLTETLMIDIYDGDYPKIEFNIDELEHFNPQTYYKG